MLMLYNTLGRRKEEFVPLKPGKVKMFVCGLTVYDDAHLGHAKAFINFDVIARWLRHSGYDVELVENITDIDDKIIRRARERGVDPVELAREFEKRFLEDMNSLKARKSVDKFPRSHDYIEAIINQIQLLLDRGYAYYLDGDIYYDVSRFAGYTKLSGMRLEELEKHRVEPKAGKRNVYDFALWKASKEGEPSWNATVKIGGREVRLGGRPGWHIEDTAITYEIFGPQYDIHGGASELIFPHHTNEIAQAEAAFGKRPFVRYWLHCGVFSIKGEKMSKSLKNFVTIREALAKHKAEAIRLLFCSTHYRKELDYSEEAIAEAEKRLGYFYAALGSFHNMQTAQKTPNDSVIEDMTVKLGEEFSDAMNDDFDAPLALTGLATALNRMRAFAETNGKIGKPAQERAVSRVLELARIFGILEDERYKEPIPREVHKLVIEREALRRERKFHEADEIRKRLREKYRIIIEDTRDGVGWYREM
jgi:cysteinyl-tRNA synthetase